MNTKRKRKDRPEISYDHQRETFLRDNKPVDEQTALDHWFAIDADWTMGAYEEMQERTTPKPPDLAR